MVGLRNPGSQPGFLLVVRSSIILGMPPKATYVYIDGFNLYYGILKKTPNSKWLNLESWTRKLLPAAQYDIQRIIFFTANVTSPEHDLQKATRQAMYHRALNTLSPLVEIKRGKFKLKTVNIQVTKEVRISARVPEEKGTDVNLAVQIVNDAHLNRFQTAVVISNDSDLEEAVAITARDLGKEVFVFNPCLGSPPTRALTQFIPPANVRDVREGAIRASQFNPTLTDQVGPFSKPTSW